MPEPAEEVVHWAYVCGAYPERFRAVAGRLQKMGINLAGHCDNPKTFEVPKRTTLIIVISDQCSHSIRDKARDAADKFDIPYIAGPYKNWVHLEARLRARGLTGRKHLELVAGGEEVVPEQGTLDTHFGTIARGTERLQQIREAAEKTQRDRAEAERVRLAAEAAARSGTPLGKPAEEVQSAPPPKEEPVSPATTPAAAPVTISMEASKHDPSIQRGTKMATERANLANNLLLESKGWILNDQIQTVVVRETGGKMDPKVLKELRAKHGFRTPPRGGNAYAWVKKGREAAGLPPLDLETTRRVRPAEVSDTAPAAPKPPAPRSTPPAASTEVRPPSAAPPSKAAPAGPVDPAEAAFDPIQALLDEFVVKHHVGKLYLSFDNGDWDVNWDQIKVVTIEKKYTRKKP